MRKPSTKPSSGKAKYAPPSARFIAPMLLLRSDSLPQGVQWLYELKLGGYRAIAFKRDGIVHLRSRNDNDFALRYPGVVKALSKLTDHMREPLQKRRELLEKKVLPRLTEPVRYAAPLDASLPVLIESVTFYKPTNGTGVNEGHTAQAGSR